MSNKLYFGDNLHILRRYIKDESVDLIYLDPPYNSDTNYNVLFKSPVSRGHRAQIQAFDDTWKWGEETERTYDELLERGGAAAIMVDALKFSLGRSDVMAYLVMMTIRLIELHRVLKQTGSLYLHCDSTASHYLKIIIDSIFGPSAFRAEIIWERTHSHNMKSKSWHKSSDTLLFYTKSDSFTFNDQFEPYEEEQLSRFKQDENGRLYKAENLTFSTVRRHRQFEWRGSKPPPHRSWGADLEKLEKWYAEGRILLKADGTPRMDGLKVYLDELPGKKIGNVWTDISRVANTSEERIGYPTQKPVALMERIIAASSNPGDVILDPFCGCGTTVHAAQRLGREWAGIDITHVAIHVISDRLARWLPQAKFDIIGQPKDLAGAQALADHDKYQFQWWATWLCGGQPFGGEKKGKDRGVDGTLEFVSRRGVHDWGVISVKGGKTVNPSMVRDLAGTVAREKAALGVFLCIAEPSREMELEAVSSGFVTLGGVEYRKIQIRTIKQLFQGKGVECPVRLTTAQKAPEVSKPKPQAAKPRPAKRAQRTADGQTSLLLPISGGRAEEVQNTLSLAAEPIHAEPTLPVKLRKRG